MPRFFKITKRDILAVKASRTGIQQNRHLDFGYQTNPFIILHSFYQILLLREMESVNYKKIFQDCSQNFTKTVKQKIKDSNKAKSNISDPHERIVCSYPVHQDIYKYSFGKHFLPSETLVDSTTGCHHNIFTLDRVMCVIGSENIFKCRPGGDKLLVCPWGIVRSTTANDFDQIPTKCGLSLKPGRKVIPLERKDSGELRIFIPCLPDDYDKVPAGYESNDIIDLIPDIDLEIVPLTGVINNVNIDCGDSYFSTHGGVVKENDILCVSGKRYIVDSVGPDAFKPGLDLVSIGKKNKFINSNKKRSVRFGTMPILNGKIATIDEKYVANIDSVTLQLKGLNKDNHGLLYVSFKNGIFNEPGYLTHDIAVPVGDF